jgi:hypothetical protein
LHNRTRLCEDAPNVLSGHAEVEGPDADTGPDRDALVRASGCEGAATTAAATNATITSLMRVPF